MATKRLIIGPAWVGDTIMAQCLFKLIKQQDPASSLDVLAPAWTFSLLSRMPEVANAIEMPINHGALKLRLRYKIAKQLHASGYDHAIVLPNSFKSALIPWLANIPLRTGWRGELRYGVLNDVRVLDKARYPLMIEQYMALGIPANATLTKPYPLPALQVSARSQQETLSQLHIKLDERPILALAAGAEFGPAKRWPIDYFARVANYFLDRNIAIWLFGSPKDREITQQIMLLTKQRCEHIAGHAVLAQTIDLLSLVSGIVSNDSGLLHVACALAKPVIAIYGPTSPAFTPPLGEQATVLQHPLACQPCFQRTCPLQHHQCMQAIRPETIIQHIHQWDLF